MSKMLKYLYFIFHFMYYIIYLYFIFLKTHLRYCLAAYLALILVYLNDLLS